MNIGVALRSKDMWDLFRTAGCSITCAILRDATTSLLQETIRIDGIKK